MSTISLPRKLLRPIVRPLRRTIRDSGYHRLRDVAIYRDFESPGLVSHFSQIMQQNRPLFVARIGGSDYDLLPAYFKDREFFASDKRYAYGVGRVREFNGYFDLENRRENFIKFLDDFILYYMDADYLTYCGGRLIGRFQRNRFRKAEANFLKAICKDKDVISYQFIEYIRPFLRSFQVWGAGKMILVVSPFSESVGLQYRRKDQLLKDCRFPDFQLATYNTKVTYSTQDDTGITLQVSTKNWHEECAEMADAIAKIDFDVALLSCGSYSMYLGHFIKNSMGKKALYLGGVLNVLFNIYGGRYEGGYDEILNLDCQIDAVENAHIEHLAAGRSARSEALNAYFGKRSR